MKYLTIIHGLIIVTCLGLTFSIWAQTSATHSKSACTLTITNKTNSPIGVGVSNGPNVFVRGHTQQAMMAPCEVLQKTYNNSNYKDLLIKKDSDKNYSMILTTSVVDSATKNNSVVVHAKTMKLQTASPNYLWVSATNNICTVPDKC